MKKLALIVPCYNEEEILKSTYASLEGLFKKLILNNEIAEDSKICFVDDGSRDNTWAIIQELCNKCNLVRGIKLARNFGHQYALLAGLESQFNQFDVYISIDADLQDDIEVVWEMLQKHKEGAAIVYGIRNDRKTDSWFKRKTAEAFYQLMQSLGVKTVNNHADFRLVTNFALAQFLQFKEVNLFMRGIFPLIGLRTATVFYQRKERLLGESKYPFRKMLTFAWEGVTSFSVKPMRMVLLLGLSTFLFSCALIGWAVYCYVLGLVIPGWFSILIPIAVFGGIQMICLGIIGEYIGKMYAEIKARPRYVIETTAARQSVYVNHVNIEHTPASLEARKV
jgi:glycosyltransferase involved in cell wall biosynthesis